MLRACEGKLPPSFKSSKTTSGRLVWGGCTAVHPHSCMSTGKASFAPRASPDPQPKTCRGHARPESPTQSGEGSGDAWRAPFAIPAQCRARLYARGNGVAQLISRAQLRFWPRRAWHRRDALMLATSLRLRCGLLRTTTTKAQISTVHTKLACALHPPHALFDEGHDLSERYFLLLL